MASSRLRLVAAASCKLIVHSGRAQGCGIGRVSPPWMGLSSAPAPAGLGGVALPADNSAGRLQPGEHMSQGVVSAVYLAPTAGAGLLPVAQARALPAQGLEGDRYFLGTGSFS